MTQKAFKGRKKEWEGERGGKEEGRDEAREKED